MQTGREGTSDLTSPKLYMASRVDPHKYTFYSPQPVQHSYPTPYTLNQNKQEHVHPGLVRDNSDANDCSLVENSMLHHHNQTVNDNCTVANNTTSAQPISGSGTSSSMLPDINEQPSSVLHFGNFANEFLLASPEQFKEFLIDSPGGLNFWQQRSTPAKTPLKFVANGSGMPPQHNLSSLNHSASPLQSIDINLMFNSVSKQTASPMRRQMSLTPYGRRVINEMGTPFTKVLQPTSSNNSALVDFHRARKNNLQTTPTSRPNLRIDSPESKIYGSSPTTIQLHSSGTKCSPDRDPNIDEKLFHLRESPTPKLSMKKSDTSLLRPNLELPKMGSFKSNNLSEASEPSLSLALRTSQDSLNYQNAPSSKVKKAKLKRSGQKNKPKSGHFLAKQRFQIIMTDTTSFNSDDGLNGSSDKLKRSQSLIIPGENKKKKKKKKFVTNFIPSSQ